MFFQLLDKKSVANTTIEDDGDENDVNDNDVGSKKDEDKDDFNRKFKLNLIRDLRSDYLISGNGFASLTILLLHLSDKVSIPCDIVQSFNKITLFTFNCRLSLLNIDKFLYFPVPGTSMGAVGILSDQSFQSLNEAVCEPTLKAIVDMGFTHMTEIQVSLQLSSTFSIFIEMSISTNASKNIVNLESRHHLGFNI